LFTVEDSVVVHPTRLSIAHTITDLLKRENIKNIQSKNVA